MKIVFSIKTLHRAKGGAERVLAVVASGLAERGHEVSVITFDLPDAGQTFYSLHPAVDLVRLGIGNAGGKATFLETLGRIFNLRNEIKAKCPDVVVGFMHSMFVPLSFALAGTKIPVVGSEHIVPAHYKTRRLEFLLFFASTFFMRKITVLSSSIRKSYPRLIRSKMVVIPNPVTAAAVAADIAGNGTPVKKILNVGRLDPQKDQETLIRAFGQVCKDYPEWRMEIVGEGILEGRLVEVIGELDLSDRVFLVPPTRQIGDLYGAAQIFALPSIYESFGLATAEAMAHGLPVIGFADCPGTNELIDHGKTGLLVDGNDRVWAFADGLRQLMGDPEKRRRLGESAKIYVSRFDKAAVLNLWEDLLGEFRR